MRICTCWPAALPPAAAEEVFTTTDCTVPEPGTSTDTGAGAEFAVLAGSLRTRPCGVISTRSPVRKASLSCVIIWVVPSSMRSVSW